MNRYNITKPIGLNSVCEEIENVCNKAQVYKRCGLRPKHLIIPLDSGSGRTTLIEYLVDKYKEVGILNFSSGLDDYIEITFDGSMQQMKQAFTAIDSAAVYTNEYCNIIGMDISGMASHLSETQCAEFVKNCNKVCEHAGVIFFVHTIPSRNEEKLLEKLCDAVDNIKRLAVEPYTREDMCALITKAVAEHGIAIRHETVFHKELLALVSEFRISRVKNAIFTADTLVNFADFSDFSPFVDENSLRAMIAYWHGNEERGKEK